MASHSALFGTSLFAFFVYAFNALRRTAVNPPIVAFESACEAGASIALVLAGAGAAGAAFGRAAGYLLGAAAAALTTGRLLGWHAIDARRASGAVRRRLFRYAGTLTIVDVSWAVFTQIDVLLIGALLTTAAVASFQAPMRLLVFLSYPTAALATAVSPALGGEPGQSESAATFASATRTAIVLQSAALAPLVVWATPIVDLLLGTSYHHAASVLRALAPYALLLGLAPLVSTTLDYLGQARSRIPFVTGALVLNLVLDLILIPRVGVVGAAIGSDIAFALYVPAHLVICMRLLQVPVPPLARTCCRCAAAAVAMGAVLWLFGTGHLTLPRMLAGAVAGMLAYAAVLLATGEVTRSEARAVLRRGSAQAGG